MNKKRTMVLVSMALGVIMIFGVAFANAASSPGYDTYKTALKNTRAATSLTAEVTATVTDNGNAVVSGSGSIKANLKNESMSGSASCTAGDKDYTSEVYCQNDQTVTKTNDSEVYNVMQRPERREAADRVRDHDQFEQKYARDVENVIDAFLGNIKDNVVVSDNSDGSKDVSLQLSGNQIPATINALASLAVKTGERQGIEKEDDLSPVAAAIKAQIPQLTDDITIGSVDIKAVIDDRNFIKTQQATVSISGKDAQGASHDLVVTLKADVSDINSTIPDTVDLTGKQVKTLQHNHRGFDQ